MDLLIAGVSVVKYRTDKKKFVHLYKPTNETHTHTHYATCPKITYSGKIARKSAITSTSATMKEFSSMLMSPCYLAVVHFVHNALIASRIAYTQTAVTRGRNHSHIFVLLLWYVSLNFEMINSRLATHMSSGLCVFWDMEYIPKLKHKLVCFHSYSFVSK
jgi:hypothetical protein